MIHIAIVFCYTQLVELTVHAAVELHQWQAIIFIIMHSSPHANIYVTECEFKYTSFSL